MVEELFHGKNTKTFANGKFDRLESTGYAGPSHVPGGQTAVESAKKQTSPNSSSNKHESTASNAVSSSQGTYPLENGPYIKNGKPNGRPTLFGKRKREFEQTVYNRCVGEDGILRDPNTEEVINWKPGQPRKGVVDFGHKPGKSYDEMFKKYKNGEISLQELKDFQFNPDNYRLETPSANRSRKYE